MCVSKRHVEILDVLILGLDFLRAETGDKLRALTRKAKARHGAMGAIQVMCAWTGTFHF
jgi:hypothetical protein